MSLKDQLLIPDAARQDSRSFELLRVWVANNAQHVSLRVGTWDDPAAWGIMLADLANHVANSYYQDAHLDPVKALQRIKAAFDAEFKLPTDSPEGEITQ